jgi:hypothetical protein
MMIRKAYRELAQLIQQMPDAAKRASSMQELRQQFRAPLLQPLTTTTTSTPDEKKKEELLLQARLKQAFDRAAFLRMTTVKSKPKGDAGRWVYKNGQRFNITEDSAAGATTARDDASTGHRVVSNWNGKNLDPESVSRHRKQLHRSGFVNNSHAKGIF